MLDKSGFAWALALNDALGMLKFVENGMKRCLLSTNHNQRKRAFDKR